MEATVRDQYGEVMAAVTVGWRSGDPSVASVSGTGLVTAEGNGTVTVEASVGDAVGTAVVTVEQKPSQVRVSPSADTLFALEDTVRLSAEALDANGRFVHGTEFDWASGDESVVTVDGAGLVASVGSGATQVTASAGSAVGAARIAVHQVPVAVTVTPSELEFVALDDTLRLGAEPFDANGHKIEGADISWLSGGSSVATVDANGLVRAVGNGEAVATATAGSASGSAVVTVAQVAKSITLEPGIPDHRR